MRTYYIIKVDCHTGAIGMQLLHDDESSQIQDAVKFVATALDRLVAAGKSLSPPTTSCRETKQWDSGLILFKWVSFHSVAFCLLFVIFCLAFETNMSHLSQNEHHVMGQASWTQLNFTC